jgi:hypothetical protein
MTNERRYNEEEVARIFEVATNAPGTPRAAGTPGEGLTLEELQSIGREVGLTPASISEAAALIDRRGRSLPRQTFLGAPIAVGHVVPLPRSVTDREWEVLLSELRETFRALGKDRSTGQVRCWTNSNLHAYVEPTEGGHRLRMGTRKGDAGALAAIGVGGLLLATSTLLGALGGGGSLSAAVVLGGMGIGALVYNALRLPRWASLREQQMEYIAGRARALLGVGGEPDARPER